MGTQAKLNHSKYESPNGPDRHRILLPSLHLNGLSVPQGLELAETLAPCAQTKQRLTMNLATTRSVFWSCSLIAYSLLPTCDRQAQQSQSAMFAPLQAASTVSNTTQPFTKRNAEPVRPCGSSVSEQRRLWCWSLQSQPGMLLIEPVILIHLSKDWILISRTIQSSRRVAAVFAADDWWRVHRDMNPWVLSVASKTRQVDLGQGHSLSYLRQRITSSGRGKCPSGRLSEH